MLLILPPSMLILEVPGLAKPAGPDPWTGPGSRPEGGGCTLVGVLLCLRARDGHRPPSEAGAKSKWPAASFATSGPPAPSAREEAGRHEDGLGHTYVSMIPLPLT